MTNVILDIEVAYDVPSCKSYDLDSLHILQTNHIKKNYVTSFNSTS
jgi:hypothetical protein